MSGDLQPHFTPLSDRGVLAITGEDRVVFLQGLVSNDVRLCSPTRAIYTWFMTPQGKYLHDFFVFDSGDALLLDVEAERRADLLKRLKMYKLRSKITLEDRSDSLGVAAVFGEGASTAVGLANGERGQVAPLAGGWAMVDPRKADLGARVILPLATLEEALTTAGCGAADFADYDRLRLTLGVADASRDLVPEKSIALENDMDALGAMSWDKGCYMGQELNARTKYRGLAKKRLVPVRLEGSASEPGTPITRGGREVGELRSSRDHLALALLRIDEMENMASETSADPLMVGESLLHLNLKD